MNKRVTIYLLIILAIILTIFILLITLKIDYYKQVPIEIKDSNVIAVLDKTPDKLFVNVNSKVYEVNNYTHLTDNLYALDFNVHKEPEDKVFCYMTTYKLNYLSYIFKIVFNI